MHRRTVLGAIGLASSTSLVGCLNTSIIRDEGNDDAGPDALTKIIRTGPAPPPDLPIKPSVNVVNESANQKEPASLRVAWVNTSSDTIRIGESRSIVFFATNSDTGTAILLAPPLAENAVTLDGCWRVTESIGIDAQYSTVELDPGENHTAETELYATGENCLTDGVHYFETDVSVFDEPVDWSDEATGTWGFELDLELVTN